MPAINASQWVVSSVHNWGGGTIANLFNSKLLVHISVIWTLNNPQIDTHFSCRRRAIDIFSA